MSLTIRCRQCGVEFRPRKESHRLCDRCYWRGRAMKKIHPRLEGVDLRFVLLVVGVAIVVAVILERCG